MNFIATENWLYSTLNNVSRSFSFVIKELPTEIRDCVAIFYLILRCLDTIEDDMSIEKNIKIELLQTFYDNMSNISKLNCGIGYDNKLVQEFDNVLNLYSNLPNLYRSIIEEITRNMSEGMIKYLNHNIVSINDYNEYCFYVAGLVGIGLSKLFVSSGLENNIDLTDEVFIDDSLLSMEMINMGIFLQKTNIIRDFFEDLTENRIYWPEEIYSKYVDSPYKLIQFHNENDKINSICCLNEMIENALQHYSYCIKYIMKLENKSIITMSAMPQIIALATLNECYNNISVFYSNVKISRELSGKILMDIKDNGVQSFIYYSNLYLNKLVSKLIHKDVIADSVSLCVSK